MKAGSARLGIRRSEFPAASRYVYLNNAAISPCSRTVHRAVQRVLNARLRYGEKKYEEWTSIIKRLRQVSARLINATPEEIAIIKNTSEGINIVANGITWRSGDNVVNCNVEFPSNLYPWVKLRERGVEVRSVGLTPEGTLDLEEIEKQIDDRTRAVAVSHVQWLNGFKIDLRRLREMTSGRCLLFVDAIQSLGAVKVDSRYVDALAAGAYKWLLAPFGVGILYVARGVDLRPLFVGWASAERPERFESSLRLAESARRFEVGGLDFAAAAGLTASIEMMLDIGVEAIERAVTELAEMAVHIGDNLNLPVQSPREKNMRGGIVNLKVKKHLEVCERLRRSGILVAPRMNGVRVSAHFYNNEADLDAFQSRLKQVINQV